MILPKWWTSWTPRTKRISPLNFCSISTFLVLMRIIRTFLSNRSCQVAYPPSTNYVTFSFSSNHIPLYASKCHIRKVSASKKENINFNFEGCGTYSTLYKRDPYLPTFGISRLMQILRYLGGLPGARLSNNNKNLQRCNQHPIFIKCKTQQTKWKGHYN